MMHDGFGTVRNYVLYMPQNQHLSYPVHREPDSSLSSMHIGDLITLAKVTTCRLPRACCKRKERMSSQNDIRTPDDDSAHFTASVPAVCSVTRK